MKKLQTQIIEWAKSKGINNPVTQQLKVIEELGEMSKELLEGDKEKFKMEIGDVSVTIIIFYWQNKERLSLKNYDLFGMPQDVAISYTLKALYEYDRYILCYLNAICKLQGTTIEECTQMAYNKIKNRQGKTINGTFVKR